LVETLLVSIAGGMTGVVLSLSATKWLVTWVLISSDRVF
jgi:hypothetical protein